MHRVRLTISRKSGIRHLRASLVYATLRVGEDDGREWDENCGDDVGGWAQDWEDDVDELIDQEN